VVTVTEDAEHQARRLQKAKQDEAEWLARHLSQDPELQQEWIRQDNLAYGRTGVAIGVQSAGITRLELGERSASRAAEAAEKPAKPDDADA
jgi:hypothetical protein